MCGSGNTKHAALFLRKLNNNFIFEMDWDTIDGFKERGQNLKPFRDGTFVYGGRGRGLEDFRKYSCSALK